MIQAFKTAGKPLVPIVGADNNEFLHQMLAQYPKLKAAAVTNPAVIGGAGAAVAIKLLAGTVGPDLGQADPARLVDAGLQEPDPGELLAEPRADVQRTASDQALDDLHHRCS